ncbi:hypothetical protein GGX14DRAFT_367147 [Mycena pura]|uniref:Uncharacterized protein n=1 Tax=Mycena pura TaxID=153505 RepID=A0AAD6YAZ0_9AGAR|nr:hypothetical protein GGX14DRAFT_367147 [Mycena pura]
MLILFLLVHLFSSTANVSRGGLHLDPRAPNDSCDDINNCRRLFDIVWGCLTTIFACTWVSVHPNVPPPDPNPPDFFWPKLKWRVIVASGPLWRRLKLMLITVIAPELMFGFAAKQFIVAQGFSKGLLEFNISRRHGYFISMGGFVTGTGGPPIVTKEQVRKHISDIANVREKVIEDKSKGDGLSKGVALLQGLWFITQCLARAIQHLPVTQLEVATVAFAVLNVFIWVLWWGKPLDVHDPIPVGFADVPEVQPPVLSRLERFVGLFNDTYENYDPLISNSVPSFWAISESDDVDDKYANTSVYAEMIVGSVFGAIHCAVWNASFPSPHEKWMWRSCAVLVTVIPLLILVCQCGHIVNSDTLRIKPGARIVAYISFPGYVLARIFLIVLPFTALRALPPGTFVDVDWSIYIPHL